MKRLFLTIALTLCVAGAGCHTFQPGPVDPETGIAAPSLFEVGVKEYGETYDEQPYRDLPYGWIVAGLISAIAAAKKVNDVRLERNTLRAEKENAQ